MVTYARIREGKLAQTYITDADGLVSIASSHQGDTFIESPYFGGPETLYYDGEAIQKIPDSPNPNYRFNPALAQWEDQRTLQEVKLTQWQKIKAARAAELESPFSTPYGSVDAKGTSKTDITDAVLMLQTLAAMGTPTTIDFTMADNTTVTLTTAQMVTVGLLLGQKVQAAHAKARGLRADIEAATTKAEVEAIVW